MSRLRRWPLGQLSRGKSCADDNLPIFSRRYQECTWASRTNFKNYAQSTDGRSRWFEKSFSRGLEEICADDFLKARYREFELKHDPIYAELLGGLEDRPLAETFVSYWMIAQTLATRSRFWLEFSIAEMLIHQAKETGNFGRCVYSQAMLSTGWLAVASALLIWVTNPGALD